MITIIAGIPRSGKTTYAVSIAVKESKKRCVFTNFSVNPRFAFPPVNRSIYKIDGKTFFNFSYPEGSLLILDEAALDFDARKWDSFPQEAVKFVKLHGHEKLDIIFISQSLSDIDKKIRSCAEKYIYVTKGLLGFSNVLSYKFVRPKSEETTLIKGGTISEENLSITVKEPSILGELFSKKVFRPFYYKAFDSYACSGSRPLLRSETW